MPEPRPEDALLFRPEWSRATLASIGDAVITTNTDGRVTFLNPVAQSLTGWTQDEAAGVSVESVFKVVHPETRVSVECPTVRALREGVNVGLANRTLLIAKDGTELPIGPIEDSAATIRNDKGEIVGAVLVFRDITELCRQERAVQVALKYADNIIATLREPFVVLDKSLRVMSANQTFYASFRVEREETEGRFIFDLGNGQWNIPRLRTLLDEVLSKHHPVEDFDMEHEFPAIGRKIMLLNARRFESVEGHSDLILLAIEDITERKQAEVALEKKNERLLLLWETASLLLSASDPDVMLHGLLAKIGPQLGVDSYFYFLVDDSGIALRLESCEGIPKEMVQSIEQLEFGQAISGTVALLRQPIVSMHIQQSSESKAELVKSFGIRAYISNPLESDNILLGTLSFGSKLKDEFAPDELTFLQTISHYVAVACAKLRTQAMVSKSEQRFRFILHRRKDEFLAMLSHELRNPLAPIINAVELLRLQSNEGEVQKKARTLIERQVGQLSRLVDDLLEVSRITTGRIHLQKERIGLNGIVERAVETTRPLMDQHRHKFSVTLSPMPIWLEADGTRMEQVIVNLLTNAAKYTPDKGLISLTVQLESDQAVLRISDTGVGISPELLPHIFELFTQSERSIDRSQGGLGIGLTLVQRLVEMHGGHVEVFSVLGQGSEFIVRLPVMATPVSQPPLPHEDVAKQTGPCLRVLVVDDNVDAAETLGLLLNASGHDVRTAYNGPNALEVAAQFRPNIVLLDIGLPGIDGYEVAKRLRQEPDLSGVVLVALTGYGTETDKQLSQDAGFNHHLVKPASFSKVKEILSTVSEKLS